MMSQSRWRWRLRWKTIWLKLSGAIGHLALATSWWVICGVGLCVHVCVYEREREIVCLWNEVFS